MRPFTDAAVKAKYKSFAPETRPKLLALRELAFRTAKNLGLPPPLESLKWGQPSFSVQGRLGSTFRLDEVRNGNGKYALYFLCQTSLVEKFRELYSGTFVFEGNRAIVFMPGGNYATDEISHCMLLAMTYGAWPKTGAVSRAGIE